MSDGAPRDPSGARRLRIVHLFPDLLSVYGDSGNLRALVVRAERRSIDVTVDRVLADATALPEADLFVVGGGQDRDQLAVERALRRLGEGIRRQVADGAGVLAVCGGYQSLGISYLTGAGRTIHGPGVFQVVTRAGSGRLVGPVVARLVDPTLAAEHETVVGFENHSGRTELCPGTAPLATVEIGHGNNDEDGTEGTLALPGEQGLHGLRIGTYLHGPFLPRNPHLADALLRSALDRTGQPTALDRLDDTDEWRAHDRFVARCRERRWPDRLPAVVRRVVEPARSLIGF
jgi:CobQ-like glutamine amidotransferase family enzyme